MASRYSILKPERNDLVGKTFGKWTVLSAAAPNANKSRQWNLRCQCGAQRTALTTSILKGSVLRRGCGPRVPGTVSHGLTNSREFKSWENMWQRTTNPKNKRYRDYGARGITVDPAWRKFEAFMADMGRCPDGLTLDRIDNDLGYSAENCRWADYSTQNRNRRRFRVTDRPARVESPR